MRACLLVGLFALFGMGEALAADFSALRGAIEDVTTPLAQPSPFIIGARYWYSTGRHDYAFNASVSDPSLGNPTSELIYTGVTAQSLEVYGRYSDDETGFVIKGYAGGGFASGGTMNDRDWFAGQQLFSNTDSTLKNTDLRYVTMDVGWGADYFTYGNMRFLPFIGYGYWRDEVGIWGLRFLPDDFGGFFAAAPPGTVLFSTSQKVGGYIASWNMVRLGVEATVTILPQLSLTVDAAAIPYAQGEGNDSHLLRQDQLGFKPNVFLRGHGWGGQVDALLRYAVTDRLTLGAGWRYWYVDGSSGYKTDRFDRLFGQRLPLTDFTSERYGALVEASYKF
ncbi:MAG: hypothetical protein JO310_13595 [Hyphomicrobiales bacterium]|nr:hypothetical protein [Hyphomicrobiales bacterium]